MHWDSPPPPPESVRTGGQTYADVRTKFSRIDRLPKLLTNSAPLPSAVFGRKGAPLIMNLMFSLLWQSGVTLTRACALGGINRP